MEGNIDGKHNADFKILFYDVIYLKKVILISIDGMRPDGLKRCGNDYLDKLINMSSYTFDAKTVYPSVTLPSHVSMFHSVPPERHGTTTNHYMVPVRPVSGLVEQLHMAGKRCAMFNSWEPLRNISDPGSLFACEYFKIGLFDRVDEKLTNKALDFIKDEKPEFVFLYLGETDEIGGHQFGWMSEEYLKRIHTAINCVKKVIETVGDEYTVIITADHGGHDRCHGTEIPEDMTIPMIFYGEDFKPNNELHGVTLLDIAPTITAILEADTPVEWEGKNLLLQL